MVPLFDTTADLVKSDRTVLPLCYLLTPVPAQTWDLRGNAHARTHAGTMNVLLCNKRVSGLLLLNAYDCSFTVWLFKPLPFTLPSPTPPPPPPSPPPPPPPPSPSSPPPPPHGVHEPTLDELPCQRKFSSERGKALFLSKRCIFLLSTGAAASSSP